MNVETNLRQEAKEQNRIAQLEREVARINRSIAIEERKRQEIERRLQAEAIKLSRLRELRLSQMS